MSELRLGHRLAGVAPSLTNGPGWRVALWTQGCSLRCTRECLNPHLLPDTGGYLVTVAEVRDRLQRLHETRPEIEGVTVLGGEPIDQAAPVAELLEAARALGWSTMVYSGHRYELLHTSEAAAVQRLLRSVDVLVDGPFIREAYHDNLAWRGSSNQRLLCLTHRYRPDDLKRRFREQQKAFSIRLTSDGVVSVSGLQERRGAAKTTLTISRSVNRSSGSAW